MDTDFHYIAEVGDIKNVVNEKDICIGNHVWIGCRTMILKGTTLADGCVVAGGSVITKSFTIKNALIAGNPAVIKKQYIEWVDER